MSRLRAFAVIAGLGSFALAFNSPASRVDAATPKSGAACTKSQSGRTSGTLVCSKSGSTYRWVKRTASSKTTRKQTSATSTPTNTQPPSASIVDIVSVNFGVAPSTASTTVDVTCTGTFAPGGNDAKSATFSSAGGASQVTLALLEPSATTPAGSACIAKATVSGASPGALLLLINGRTAAGPSAASNVTSTSFTAWGSLAVTVVAEYGTAASGAPAPTVVPTTSAGAVPITTIAGTSTTTTLAPGATLPPPASGRPEVRNVMVGAVPAAVSGVDVTVTCATPGSPLQTQTVRIPTAQTAAAPIALTTGATTECQATANLVGLVDTSAVRARVLLNGQQIAGPVIGSLVNSPAFRAALPFTVSSEFAFGGATSATTTVPTTVPVGVTSTTTPGSGLPGVSTSIPAASTTIPGAGVPNGFGSIAFVPNGAVPATVTGYVVELTCTNLVVGGVTQPSVTYSATFARTAATVPFSFGFTPASTCTVKATTAPATTNAGTVSISVNGTALGSGAAGTATTSSFSAPSAPQIRVAVSY